MIERLVDDGDSTPAWDAIALWANVTIRGYRLTTDALIGFSLSKSLESDLGLRVLRRVVAHFHFTSSLALAVFHRSRLGGLFPVEYQYEIGTIAPDASHCSYVTNFRPSFV